VSRAERVSSCVECLLSSCALFVGRLRELSAYLHVLSVVVCMCLACWQNLRAGRVSSCAERLSSRELSISLYVSRAERLSSVSFLCLALSVCLHAPRELSVCVHVSARMEG
jgi:hypothetical protein